jgi:hypothetical protein
MRKLLLAFAAAGALSLPSSCRPCGYGRLQRRRSESIWHVFRRLGPTCGGLYKFRPAGRRNLHQRRGVVGRMLWIECRHLWDIAQLHDFGLD